jgi:hypothetical protein
MTQSTTGRLVAASVLALALAGLAPEVHGHGGDGTKIHACVNQSSGEVKILGASATCKPHETAVDWAIEAAAAPVPRILTEISLVSVLPGFNNGPLGPSEKSRFLWEPDRYDPAPAEMFLEVVGAVFEESPGSGGSATFELREVATDLLIAGASLTVNAGDSGRFRTGDIAPSFPSAPVEIKLVVTLTAGAASYSLQRSAVLVQQ